MFIREVFSAEKAHGAPLLLAFAAARLGLALIRFAMETWLAFAISAYEVHNPHPDLVGRIHLELRFQDVGHDDRRLSTVSPRAALAADLGQDACKASQPGDTALGSLLSLIAQIISELAIAVDLTDVEPGLPDQLRLAEIVPRMQA